MYIYNRRNTSLTFIRKLFSFNVFTCFHLKVDCTLGRIPFLSSVKESSITYHIFRTKWFNPKQLVVFFVLFFNFIIKQHLFRLTGKRIK